MTSVPSEYYESLFEVARTINSTLSLPQVLNRIAESTTRAMRARACSIRLLSPLDEALSIGAVYGLSERYLAKGPVQVSQSGIDREALKGSVVAVEDATTDPGFQYPQEAAAEGIRSVLVAPLAVRGVAIGVIRVYTGETRQFAEHEKDFLRAIAELSAIAIDNARVYETLQAELLAIRREKIPWAENFAKPSWR
jgi:GAF domain-containing protein